MATQSPIPFLDGLIDSLGQRLAPPPWFVHEAQRRVVLLVNHVLMQEPEAQARLRRQAGRVLEAHWRVFSLRVRATPAGLLELAEPGVPADLTLMVTEESPFSLARVALRGEKPPVRIAGDVQFAAEVNWLVDHVRWDLEEDLSRVIGDGPAHALGQFGRSAADALRRFVAPPPPPTPGAGPAGGSGQAGS